MRLVLGARSQPTPHVAPYGPPEHAFLSYLGDVLHRACGGLVSWDTVVIEVGRESYEPLQDARSRFVALVLCIGDRARYRHGNVAIREGHGGFVATDGRGQAGCAGGYSGWDSLGQGTIIKLYPTSHDITNVIRNILATYRVLPPRCARISHLALPCIARAAIQAPLCSSRCTMSTYAGNSPGGQGGQQGNPSVPPFPSGSDDSDRRRGAADGQTGNPVDPPLPPSQPGFPMRTKQEPIVARGCLRSRRPPS